MKPRRYPTRDPLVWYELRACRIAAFFGVIVTSLLLFWGIVTFGVAAVEWLAGALSMSEAVASRGMSV